MQKPTLIHPFAWWYGILFATLFRCEVIVQATLYRKEVHMKSQLSITAKQPLNDGREIPCFGFGTWQLATGQQGIQALLTALESGYRQIDTARAYDNENLVGKAVRESKVPRNEIFISSKLWNTDHGRKEAKRACEKSLDALGTDYIDLYLIHWPSGGRNRETWEALLELQNEGKCRSVGVSNFGVDDLTDLMKHFDTIPAVNQIEFNVFVYPRELASFCQKNDIAVQAYSPLARGRGLKDAIVNEIAHEYDKQPNQVMLRWALQHGAIVIPKSSTPEHILSNAQVFDFELSENNMQRLDGLSL